MIKPTHKIRRKNSPWYNRTWAEAIDICIGSNASKWGWQCGINAGIPTANDNPIDYYMWYWHESAFYSIPITNDLSDYITEICKKRNFVP